MCQSIEWITRKDKQTAIQVIKSDEQNDMQPDTAWMLMKVTIPETKVYEEEKQNFVSGFKSKFTGNWPGL